MDLTEAKKQVDLASSESDSKATDHLVAALRAIIEEIENDDERAWEESMGEDL